jgi:hypothetical protein
MINRSYKGFCISYVVKKVVSYERKKNEPTSLTGFIEALGLVKEKEELLTKLIESHVLMRLGSSPVTDSVEMIEIGNMNSADVTVVAETKRKRGVQTI